MANDAAHPEPGQYPEPRLESIPMLPGPPADWFVLLDRIEREVRQLEAHRQAWRDLSSAGEFNVSGSSDASGTSDPSGPIDGSSGPAWLGHLYFRSQALGVRRMVDGDRRAGSFKRLLHKMTEDCVRLTRGWFIESGAGTADVAGAMDNHQSVAVPATAAEDADTQFTLYADPWRSGHLDSEVPREDLRTLESSCNAIKRYVDQYFTHAQLDPDAETPDLADVDAAIDVLLSLLAKYTLLLRPGTARGRLPADPVV